MEIKHYLLGIILLMTQAVTGQKLLLTNATIIDGDAKVLTRVASIRIEDGIIKRISVKNNRKEFKNVQVINCTGKFVTPGLFDAHVHLGTLDLRDLSKAHSIIDSITLNMVKHGITTVRDMAGDAPFLKTYKEQAGKGRPVPDIFYAAQFAGPSYFKLLGQGRSSEKVGVSPWERAISDTTDIEKAVVEAKRAGVTGIKVYADLSEESVNKITHAAFKHGLMAWSHAAVFPVKPSVIAKAGVTSMSHANDLVFEQLPGDTIEVGKAWEAVYNGLKVDFSQIDPLLLTMKKNGIYLDPTLFHASNNNMINADIISKRAHELGLKFVAGTDWFYPTKDEPVPLMEELKLLHLKIGLTKREVIEAATRNSALVTGLHDRGIIKKGKRADLLVLDKNPLENLEALFEPEIVMQNGKIVISRNN